MPNDRRARIPGAGCFFTLALADRSSSLFTDRIEDLCCACAQTVRVDPVFCDAMVILPDHLRAVWTLPPGDAGVSERWRKIEHRFSRKLGRTAHPKLAGVGGPNALREIAAAGRRASTGRPHGPAICRRARGAPVFGCVWLA